MSIMETTEVQCPECGSKSEMDIWSRIDTHVDPEAKDELLRGKINLFHCDVCGFEDFVPVDFLYHDMQNRFCVHFFPFQMIDDDEFCDQFTEEGNLELDFEVAHDYLRNPHVVFGMDELVRYIVFRDRLARCKAGGNAEYVPCFSCDNDIEGSERCFIVSRLRQVKDDADEDKDEIVEVVASLQICAECMVRAATEDLTFPDLPLPALTLEKEGVYHFARSRAGKPVEPAAIAKGRGSCSLCHAAIETGDTYTRIELTEETGNMELSEVKKIYTLAVSCESCSQKYMVWL